MMTVEMLLDIASPETAAVGIMAGIGFFLVFVAVAYIVFRLLRRTMRMAFRLAIVVVILIVAVVGSMTILAVSYSYAPHPRRPVTRPR